MMLRGETEWFQNVTGFFFLSHPTAAYIQLNPSSRVSLTTVNASRVIRVPSNSRMYAHECMHANDGSIVFDTRNDLTQGYRIICDVIPKWGLTVHAGYGDKKSKSEAMCFPSARKIKEWRNKMTIKQKSKAAVNERQ